MKNLAKIFYNSVLTMLLFGILLLPVFSVGVLRMKPKATRLDVLSTKDVRILKPADKSGTAPKFVRPVADEPEESTSSMEQEKPEELRP